MTGFPVATGAGVMCPPPPPGSGTSGVTTGIGVNAGPPTTGGRLATPRAGDVGPTTGAAVPPTTFPGEINVPDEVLLPLPPHAQSAATARSAAERISCMLEPSKARRTDPRSECTRMPYFVSKTPISVIAEFPHVSALEPGTAARAAGVQSIA
jgi:hypothetical protein